MQISGLFFEVHTVYSLPFKMQVWYIERARIGRMILLLPVLIQLAKEYGFADTYMLDSSFAADAPQGILSLLLLVYPYHSWGEASLGFARISTYYYAAHIAHQKAKKMAEALNDMGEDAQLCGDVRLKPLLSQLSDFSQGKNSLHYHKRFSSRFQIQTIGLHQHYAMDESILKKTEGDMCGACRKCMNACPTSAITPEGFERAKCLRQHMMEGKITPVDMRTKMGNFLLGCDICQQVCPHNGRLKTEEPNGDLYEIDLLLKKDQALLSLLTLNVGRNMSLPNRILAQACIVAGNSGDPAYLPTLRDLCTHPSAVVAEHAAWAVKNLTIEAI